MKERGILFVDEMVRALLDGRKTQTRRLIKAPKGGAYAGEIVGVDRIADFWRMTRKLDRRRSVAWVDDVRCPYGVVGDRLWVKETHAIQEELSEEEHDIAYDDEGGDFGYVSAPAELYTWIHYRATPHVGIRVSPSFERMRYLHESQPAEATIIKKWRPSIFMKRAHTRLMLEITGVRAERLQSITEDDARAEGFTDKMSFALRFNHINGEGVWQTNPWVWAISFRVLDNRQQWRQGGGDWAFNAEEAA